MPGYDDDFELISDEREWSDQEHQMENDGFAGGEVGWEGKQRYKSAHSQRSRDIMNEYRENN